MEELPKTMNARDAKSGRMPQLAGEITFGDVLKLLTGKPVELISWRSHVFSPTLP